jgi:YbgC/YbaW family acyl-CoA thioester hydrolase
MSATFQTTQRVEFADTDMAGIVHFSAFFRYMEAAEHAFLRSRGLSVVLEWEGEKLGFPRVAASCDFTQPVRFEDVVDIAVHLARIGSKSLSYEFAFSHQGAAVAAGKISCVCCRFVSSPKGIESIPIPAGVRARLIGEAPGQPPA